MNVKTTKKDLLGVLNAAIKAIPAKASIPIMECFRIKASDERMEVAATDGALTIFAYAKAEGDALACLNARMLLDAVRLLPDTDIELAFENDTCTVNYGNGRFSIPTYPIEDYPTIEVSDSGNTSAFVGAALKGAIAYVLPSVAKDPMRPILNGIFFNPADDGFDLVASDAHTLSVEHIACEDIKTGPMVIPTNAVTFLKDNIKDDMVVLVSEDEGKAYFYLDDIVVSVVKVVGNFPKYETIIPKNNESVLVAPVGELLATVRRVATCANKASNVVKLSLRTFGGCDIEAQDLGFGCAAKEEMGFAEYNGQEMEIGFKHDLLSNLLGAIDNEKATIALDNPKRAALLTSENTNRRALIMPVVIV